MPSPNRRRAVAIAEILTIRKVADRTAGDRIRRFDPETGEPFLVNPTTGAAEPWPLAGVQIENEGGAPMETTVSPQFIRRGVAEGWIEVAGDQVVFRPGGTEDDPWKTTHTFIHYDAIVLKTLEGDVRYRVTENPDKWHSGPEGTDVVGDPDAEVRHFYTLALEGTSSPAPTEG